MTSDTFQQNRPPWGGLWVLPWKSNLASKTPGKSRIDRWAEARRIPAKISSLPQSFGRSRRSPQLRRPLALAGIPRW